LLLVREGWIRLSLLNIELLVSFCLLMFLVFKHAEVCYCFVRFRDLLSSEISCEYVYIVFGFGFGLFIVFAFISFVLDKLIDLDWFLLILLWIVPPRYLYDDLAKNDRFLSIPSFIDVF